MGVLMEKPKKLTDREIVAAMHRRVDKAMNAPDGDISTNRERGIKIYRGDKDGRERKDRSEYIDRIVYDIIEWLLPQILKPFVGSARALEYTGRNANDERAARMETDVVRHVLMRQNNGYSALESWFKDMLLSPTSYTKLWMEERETTKEERYEGLTSTQVEALWAEDGVELVEWDSEPGFVPPPPGAPVGTPMQPEEFFKLNVKRTEKRRRLRFKSIPAEEVLVEAGWTELSLRDCPFVAHRRSATRSELREMGVPESLLQMVSGARERPISDETYNRFIYDDEVDETNEEVDSSQAKFWYHECYVMMDMEGRGIAERRKVCLIGDQVFENEPLEVQPIIPLSYTSIPHTHEGLSLVDAVKQLQEISTAMWRQNIDSVYKKGAGRVYIHEKAYTRGGETEEQLEDAFSEVVKVALAPADAVLPDPAQTVTAEVQPLTEKFADMARMRTGVRPDQNLDPSVLQRTPSAPAEMMHIQGNAQIEGLVRRIAETGITELMLNAHAYMRLYPDKPLSMKLNDEYVEVDPSDWDERTEVEVKVGLGFHSAEKLTALLMTLFGVQKEAQPMGLAGPQHFHKTFRQLVEGMDAGDVNSFFDDPTRQGWQPPPPPQPDPLQVAQVQLAQAQAENLKADNERAMAEMKLKFEAEQAKTQAEIRKSELEVERTRADVALKIQEARVRERELALKAIEVRARYGLTADETAAGIRETEANTTLKKAQTIKTLEEAKAAKNPPAKPDSDD